MKRRVAVFTIVWAYVTNALWVPGGLDDGYLLSLFFPAYYYFLIGGLVAVAYEHLAKRMPSTLVVAAFSALLLEITGWMFNDFQTGMYLGVCFAAGTALASVASTSRFTIHKAALCTLGIFGFFSLGNDLISSGLPLVGLDFDKDMSTSKSYRCYMVSDLDTEAKDVFVTPRRTVLFWFGHKICYAVDTPTRMEWESDTSLRITAQGSGEITYHTLKASWNSYQDAVAEPGRPLHGTFRN